MSTLRLRTFPYISSHEQHPCCLRPPHLPAATATARRINTKTPNHRYRLHQYQPQHHLSQSFKFRRIALPPRKYLLSLPDQIRTLLTPRLDTHSIRHRMTHKTRLKRDLGLHGFAILNRLLDVEDGQRLRDGSEEGIVSDIAPRADATSVAESPCSGVWLCSMGRCGDVAFWAESLGVWVYFGVVGEPPRRALINVTTVKLFCSSSPIVGQHHCSLWYSVPLNTVFFRTAMRQRHRRDGVPSMRFLDYCLDIWQTCFVACNW